MIYLLAIIIIVLSLIILWQGIAFRRTRLDHERKLGELQYVILELTADNREKLDRVKLSDELREKLLSAREKLDRDLMSIQRDLIEKLGRNGIID